MNHLAKVLFTYGLSTIHYKQTFDGLSSNPNFYSASGLRRHGIHGAIGGIDFSMGDVRGMNLGKLWELDDH